MTETLAPSQLEETTAGGHWLWYTVPHCGKMPQPLSPKAGGILDNTLLHTASHEIGEQAAFAKFRLAERLDMRFGLDRRDHRDHDGVGGRCGSDWSDGGSHTDDLLYCGADRSKAAVAVSRLLTPGPPCIATGAAEKGF